MPTILIPGGTGLIGMHLSRMLTEIDCTVLHLSRTRNLDAEFPAYRWDVEKGTIEEEPILRADYIINLAGEGIADKRWTEQRKKAIIASRVNSNALLKSHLEKLSKVPNPQSPILNPHSLKAYLSPSGIGYYGDRGEELLHESSPPGKKGFLSESVIAWENSIRQMNETSVRTVILRTGIVLSSQGGALKKMAQPMKFFAGAWFGSGRQWYSWIHIEDLCRIFISAVENEQMSGIYNAVSPNPERNKDFILAIRKALGKPAIIAPAPEFGLRLALGEMADAILGSAKVLPEKLLQTGFQFQFPELLPALKDLFVRKI